MWRLGSRYMCSLPDKQSINRQVASFMRYAEREPAWNDCRLSIKYASSNGPQSGCDVWERCIWGWLFLFRWSEVRLSCRPLAGCVHTKAEGDTCGPSQKSLAPGLGLGLGPGPATDFVQQRRIAPIFNRPWTYSASHRRNRHRIAPETTRRRRRLTSEFRRRQGIWSLSRHPTPPGSIGSGPSGHRVILARRGPYPKNCRRIDRQVRLLQGSPPWLALVCRAERIHPGLLGEDASSPSHNLAPDILGLWFGHIESQHQRSIVKFCQDWRGGKGGGVPRLEHLNERDHSQCTSNSASSLDARTWEDPHCLRYVRQWYRFHDMLLLQVGWEVRTKKMLTVITSHQHTSVGRDEVAVTADKLACLTSYWRHGRSLIQGKRTRACCW